MTDISGSLTGVGAGTTAVVLGSGTASTAGALYYTGSSSRDFIRPITVQTGGGEFETASTGVTTTLTNNIGLSGNFLVEGAGNTTISGVISSTSTAGSLTKNGAGTLSLSNANTFTGNTLVSAGTLKVGNNLALQNSTLDTSGAGVVNVTDYTTPTLGGLSGSKDLTSVITTGYGSVTALTLNPGTGITDTYSGAIANGASNMTLTKSGAGTQVLSGANTYTGATTVSAGRLVVSGSIGNSAVTVSGAGTILATDAAASFGGTLAINNGAILAAGDAGAAGTATVTGATTFNNGSIFSWDINSTGLSYDRLISSSLVDGDATGGAVFRIVAADATFADTFWDTTRTWADIFTTHGATAIADWANIFSSTVSVVNSSFSTISPVGGNFSVTGTTLTWTAVPEPTSALAGLL